MMHIVLFGKNGQLGQEIMKEAQKAGITLSAYGHEDLDVTDAKKIATELDTKKPDIVINTSAFHVVPQCETEADKAFLVNAVAVGNLAGLCAERAIRFVTYSTDYVFDGTKGTPYTEDDQPHPLQMYGLSKLAGEIAAHNRNDDTIIIRTCGVYGGGKQGSRSKKGNFPLQILREAETKQKLEVSSEQMVNPTYAGDLAKATLALLQKRAVPGIYHLAPQGHCSWAQFAAEVTRIKKLPMKIIPIDRGGQSGAMKRPLFSALENTKAKALGVELPAWQEGLQRYLETI